MHTTPTDTALTNNILTQLREAKAEARLVMQRVQTKALETLEALMDEPEPTGDPKQDAFIARERNRRRMAATQALTHIRSVQREERSAGKARAKAEEQNENARDVALASYASAADCTICSGLPDDCLSGQHNDTVAQVHKPLLGQADVLDNRASTNRRVQFGEVGRRG